MKMTAAAAAADAITASAAAVATTIAMDIKLIKGRQTETGLP